MSAQPSRAAWAAFYAAAAEFQRAQPWTELGDDEIFGLRDPDSGEIGWCCVLGAGGDLRGLALYVSARGLDFLRRVLNGESDADEGLLGQDALSVAFLPRAELSPAGKRQIQAAGASFARGAELPEADSQAFGRLPREPDAAELARLTLALEQALCVAEHARHARAELAEDAQGQLLLRERDAQLNWHNARALPPAPLEPAPFAFDALRAERARRGLAQSESVLEFDARALPTGIEDDGRPPYFPLGCMLVDARDGIILGFALVHPLDADERLAPELLEALEKHGQRPAALRLMRVGLAQRLEPLAAALGVRLECVPELPALEEAIAAVASQMLRD